MAAPKTTRLSNDLTKPQPTDPGDAPADTWDPKERAHSATPDKGAAAAEGHRTVNAVIPGDPIPTPAPVASPRTETYTAYDSQGNPVEIEHDIDNGTTEVSVEDPGDS